MKKLFSLLMALFLFPSVSIASSSVMVDCYQYAIDSANAEESQSGWYAFNTMDYYEWVGVALDYYQMCEDAGGNIAPPVFL